MSIDLCFILKPDGLWRTCILCGQPFRIASTAETFRENRQGRICEVRFGPRHPHNLMQLQCEACPPRGGLDHAVAAGPRDHRSGLRAAGLESWRDYGG